MENEIERLKKIYVKYLQSVQNNGTWMSPIIQPEINRQMNLIKNAKNLQQIASISTIPSWFDGILFKGIQPLSGKPINHLKFNFDSSPTGWVGIYGQTQTYSVTCALSRTTLNPSSDGTTSILCLSGGFGKNKEWYPFKFLFPGVSTYFSQSDTTIKITYNGNTFSIQQNEIKGDIIIKGKSFTFNAVPNSNAIYNGINGCVPICFGGVGTNYWSFTNLQLTITETGTGTTETGLGWFDHQWISTGVPNGFWEQFLFGLINDNKSKIGLKWIWLAMQKTSDLKNTNEQYAGSFNISSNVQKGNILNGNCIHYINGKVTNYSKQFQVEIIELKDGYPVVLKVKIDDRELNMTPKSTNIVELLSGIKNWEGPVKITENGKDWGVGFIEVNNLKPGNSGIEEILKSQGLIQNNLNFPKYFSNSYTMFVILGAIILLICIYIAIKPFYKNK